MFLECISSCSKDGNVVMGFANSHQWHTIFSISGCGKSIKDFSAEPDEDEILMPFSVEYRVENHFTNTQGRQHIVSLQVLNSDHVEIESSNNYNKNNKRGYDSTLDSLRGNKKRRNEDGL